MLIVRSTVCQCGHEKAVHHNELGCCSCECREFVLPANSKLKIECVVCGAVFETVTELVEHKQFWSVGGGSRSLIKHEAGKKALKER